MAIVSKETSESTQTELSKRMRENMRAWKTLSSEVEQEFVREIIDASRKAGPRDFLSSQILINRFVDAIKKQTGHMPHLMSRIDFGEGVSLIVMAERPREWDTERRAMMVFSRSAVVGQDAHGPFAVIAERWNTLLALYLPEGLVGKELSLQETTAAPSAGD